MPRSAFLPFLVFLLHAGAAAAQAPAIDALLREGVRLRVEHRDADAYATFGSAWEGCRCAEARAQMALAAQALGRWCDAAALLDDALRAPGDAFVAQHAAALAEARREIAARVGAVRVEVDAPGARVTLDGAVVAPAPAMHCVAAGTHALAVTAPGRASVARSLAVDAGARLDLGLSLPAVAARPPPSAVPRIARAARWVTLGAGAGALAAGITGTAIEADRVARWNDDPRCLVDGLSRAENCGSLLATADDAHAAAVAGYVALGALAAATTVLWVLASRGAPRGRVGVVCAPDLRGAAVTCAGRF